MAIKPQRYSRWCRQDRVVNNALNGQRPEFIYGLCSESSISTRGPGSDSESHLVDDDGGGVCGYSLLNLAIFAYPMSSLYKINNKKYARAEIPSFFSSSPFNSIIWSWVSPVEVIETDRQRRRLSLNGLKRPVK